MDIIAILLSTVVTAYMIYSTVTELRLVKNYPLNSKAVKGYVVDKLFVEKVAKGRELIEVCRPKCKATVNGEDKFYTSIIKHGNVTDGQEVFLNYDVATGNLYSLSDIKIYKKNVWLRLAGVIGLVVVMIIISILL